MIFTRVRERERERVCVCVRERERESIREYEGRPVNWTKNTSITASTLKDQLPD